MSARWKLTLNFPLLLLSSPLSVSFIEGGCCCCCINGAGWLFKLDTLEDRIVVSNLSTTLDQSAISTAVTVRSTLSRPTFPSPSPPSSSEFVDIDAVKSLQAPPKATISAPAPPPIQTICFPFVPLSSDNDCPKSSNFKTALKTPAYPSARVALHRRAYARSNSSSASVKAESKSRLYRCDLIVWMSGLRSNWFSSPSFVSCVGVC